MTTLLRVVEPPSSPLPPRRHRQPLLQRPPALQQDDEHDEAPLLPPPSLHRQENHRYDYTCIHPATGPQEEEEAGDCPQKRVSSLPTTTGSSEQTGEASSTVATSPWVVVEQDDAKTSSSTSPPAMTTTTSGVLSSWDSNDDALASSSSPLLDDNDSDDDLPPPLEPVPFLPEQAWHHEQQPMTVPVATSNNTPKGLVNLGNTCYMNAALQLLASLCDNGRHGDEPNNFLGRGGTTEVPASSSHNNSHHDLSVPPPLHSALRQVLQRLVGDESLAEDNGMDDDTFVRRWKQVLDQHTCLFIDNNEQEDAHEFLTTLLDLLDREYKQQLQQALQQEEGTSSNEPVDLQQEDHPQTSATSPAALETADGTWTNEDYWMMPGEEEEKKEEAGPTLPSPPPTQPRPGKIVVQRHGQSHKMDWTRHNCSSFSELDVTDIGHLLHDDCSCASGDGEDDYYHVCGGSAGGNAAGALTTTETTTCKLAGGRMNMPSDEPSYSFLPPPATQTTYSTAATPPSLAGEHPSTTTMPLTVSPSIHHHETQEGAEQLESSSAKPSSPIDDCFALKVRVHLTCDSCSYTRSNVESYWHLSLDLGNNGNTSLMEGLARFFAPERRELKCSKCFAESATQRMEIVQLPRALLLHLKRFTVDVVMNNNRSRSINPFSLDVDDDDSASNHNHNNNDYFASVSYSKNSSPVTLVDQLTLSSEEQDDDEVATVGWWKEFVASDCVAPTGQSVLQSGARYSLRSVVNHKGSSASHGHYTTDAYRCRPGQRVEDAVDASTTCTDKSSPVQREWMRFDDTLVSPITPHQALTESSRTAYMVLYEFQEP